MKAEYKVGANDRVRVKVETTAPCALNVQGYFRGEKLFALSGPTERPIELPPEPVTEPLTGSDLVLYIRLRRIPTVPVNPTLEVLLDGGREGRKKIEAKLPDDQKSLRRRLSIEFRS